MREADKASLEGPAPVLHCIGYPVLSSMDNSPGITAPHLKPTRASRVGERLLWFANFWDSLVLLLLMLATVPTIWLSSSTLVFVGEPNVMEDSWILDTIFKSVRGLWLGRDVAFTYGPFYQWLSSLPVRWYHLSLGNAYATWRVVPLYLGLVLAFVTLRLLLPEQPSWKRAVLLLLLIVFWAPADLRPFIAIFLFAAFFPGLALRQDGTAAACRVRFCQ